MSRLCERYWFPLYVYLRRVGHPLDDAQDLVQGFFSLFLEKNYFKNLDPARGRFRSYLLGAMKHYLANERERFSTQRRGGKAVHIDFADAELRYSADTGRDVDPERVYERKWVFSVLRNVLDDLRNDYAARGQAQVFDVLSVFLPGSAEGISHAEAAGRLGINVGAVKVAVHRLRSRCRRRLHHEISKTVDSPDGFQEELDFMLRILGT